MLHYCLLTALSCQGKSLDVIPNDWPHQGNLSGLQALLQEADPQRTYYISLDMYEVLGGKKRSIRSTWSKMIRCVNGEYP